ncbi:MAG: (Na+)-NQR maturation NqrM [Psychrobium sp.]|nr:(Na+)-NQR maturation NqrM [Psychrobium sp.]
MMTFFITFAAFFIVIVAMSVGYIFQNKTLAGSCGGLGAVGIEKACDCDDPCDKRKKKMELDQIKISFIE